MQTESSKSSKKQGMKAKKKEKMRKNQMET